MLFIAFNFLGLGRWSPIDAMLFVWKGLGLWKRTMVDFIGNLDTQNVYVPDPLPCTSKEYTNWGTQHLSRQLVFTSEFGVGQEVPQLMYVLLTCKWKRLSIDAPSRDVSLSVFLPHRPSNTDIPHIATTLQQLILTDRQRPFNYPNENDDLKVFTILIISWHVMTSWRDVMAWRHTITSHDITCHDKVNLQMPSHLIIKKSCHALMPCPQYFVSYFMTCYDVMTSRRDVLTSHHNITWHHMSW